MSDAGLTSQCPTELLEQLAQLAERDSDIALARTDELLEAHPTDAKLHFLRGSLLAGAGRFDEALAPMSQAIQIDPNFQLARFQFGFLQLTSGDVSSAQETWRPLTALPEVNALRNFVSGLQFLVTDEFEKADMFLRQGMALNVENPAINADMVLIADRIEIIRSEGEMTSSADWLIREATKKTKH